MENLGEFIPDILEVISLLFLITSIAIAVIIVLEKRSPFKTAAWVLVLVLLPFFGLFFYLFFGQEFRRRKLYTKKGIKELAKIRKLTANQVKQIHQNHLNLDQKIIEKAKLIALLLNNSDSLLTTGNSLKVINNGEDTFDEIFTSLKNATHHIHLEYYIIEDDEIGNQLKDILIQKSQEGVEVRVIIDDVGSWGLKKKFIRQLTSAGIEFYSFMEVRFPRLTSRANYRNHRKILIIDGNVGFLGGTNFAYRYKYGLPKIGPWRDTQLKLTGDAVSCLQVIFAVDWYFVSKIQLKGKKYFQPFSNSSGIPVQITPSGPDSDWESIGQAFFAAITDAKKYVYITTPYLVPPLHILEALKTAALGGIDVRILIPEKSDAKVTKWCSFSFVGKLLEAGVKVYFYQKGFVHSKVIISDDIFSSIGTTNLDFRSIETNLEINAFMYDEKVTKDLKRSFINDLSGSRQINMNEWGQRHWFNKLRESLAHIVSPLL